MRALQAVGLQQVLVEKVRCLGDRAQLAVGGCVQDVASQQRQPDMIDGAARDR